MLVHRSSRPEWSAGPRFGDPAPPDRSHLDHM